MYKFTWPSIGVHKKLKFFSLKGCKNLKTFPRKFEIESLEILIFSICLKVKRIPPSLGKTRKVCQSFYWMMCGVQGLKRNWSKNGLYVNSAKPEDGSRSMRHLVSYEEPQWGQRMWGELLERDTSYLHIECSTLTISAALMWKWHLNSNFMAYSPFYHL